MVGHKELLPVAGYCYFMFRTIYPRTVGNYGDISTQKQWEINGKIREYPSTNEGFMVICWE
jgi:hypothetical protein